MADPTGCRPARRRLERKRARPGSPRALGLRDPTVEVAYPLSGSTRFIDGDGKPVAEPVAGKDACSPIVRRDRLSPSSLTRAWRSARTSSPATSVRLPASQWRTSGSRLGSAGFTICSASRARIVEVGDAERRQLERDLHDGAQQRLLALTYELRLARAAAEAEGDGQLAARLDGAVKDAHTALEELRELAHGIYPAILAEAGLSSAL